MSYEGYEEKLCSNGHLTEINQWMEVQCCRSGICKAPFVFSHEVDETNGVLFDDNDNELSHTIPFPFKVVGFDDDWKRDHYGNNYAVKILKYEIPSGDKQQ